MFCYIGKHFSSFVEETLYYLCIGCYVLFELNVCVRLGAHRRRQPRITHGCVYDV
jgi:hypothetical protein